jgi:hypothetical protein
VIRFFSESNPVKILLIFILGIFIRIPCFTEPAPLPTSLDAGFFYLLLTDLFSSSNQSIYWIPSLITYILIFLQGLSLNGFINSQKLFGSSHLLFVFIYILFSSLMPEWNVLTPYVLVNTIMVYVLPKIVDLYQKQHVQNELFMLSGLISFCALIYKPSIILMLVFYISILIIRTFRLSEWVIALIGFLLPYYLMFIYAYVWEQSSVWSQILPAIRMHKPFFGREPAGLISVSLLLIPVILGAWYVYTYKKRTLVLPRKIWAIIFYYFLITVIISLGFQNKYYDSLLLALLPASFYITGFFYYPAGKFLPAVFSWLIIGFLLVRNFL